MLGFNLLHSATSKNIMHKLLTGAFNTESLFSFLDDLYEKLVNVL